MIEKTFLQLTKWGPRYGEVDIGEFYGLLGI